MQSVAFFCRVYSVLVFCQMLLQLQCRRDLDYRLVCCHSANVFPDDIAVAVYQKRGRRESDTRERITHFATAIKGNRVADVVLFNVGMNFRQLRVRHGNCDYFEFVVAELFV